jgi:hypothetical protein
MTKVVEEQELPETEVAAVRYAALPSLVEISTVRPRWDDVIIATANTAKIPPDRRNEFLKETLEGLKLIFPNNKVLIISENVKLGITDRKVYTLEIPDNLSLKKRQKWLEKAKNLIKTKKVKPLYNEAPYGSDRW